MFNGKAWAITFGIMAFIVGVVMYAPLWVGDVLVGVSCVFALYCIVNLMLLIRKEWNVD